MKTRVDPDQLASEEASWSGSTLFSKKWVYNFKKVKSNWAYKVEYGMVSFQGNVTFKESVINAGHVFSNADNEG